EKGLVERNTHPEDRRCFMVSLTSKGKSKVKEMLPKIQEVRLKAWEGLSERDFNHFRRILNTIYENLGGDNGQP
ncbi:MAG TPA: MarR family transcriptional regulator, partial [Cyclobacteriaceae bacterium]